MSEGVDLNNFPLLDANHSFQIQHWNLLWCHSLGHHQFCTTEIGRSNPDQFLIPLTKCILLSIETFLSDIILFTKKLKELLISSQGKIHQQGFAPSEN